MIKKIFFNFVLSVFIIGLQAQDVKVLFIGNSYTAVNDLPNLFKNLALSTGDHITISSNTPGGSTFQNHCSNQSATLIQQGGWDYVVLQEQSQLPSFPISQVQTQCFPYATQLNQMVETNSPCGETVFYMTWGRKYGDPDNAGSFPPLATYEGMDSLLYERYMQMTQDNNAIVSPVGRVWRYLRTNHPEIELYDSDNSHPSLAGSYAAACSFYTTILRKDPTLTTYNPGITPNVAQIIQNAVKAVVFDTLSMWYIGERNLTADFSYNNIIGFSNLSLNTNNTTTYYWDFGNGDYSTDMNPTYNYNSNGVYMVRLTATDSCGQESTIEKEITAEVVQVKDFESNFLIYPNPVITNLNVENRRSENSFYIQIIDIAGKIVFEKSSKSNMETIELSYLKPGIYIIKFEENGKVTYSKIIKQ
ncbi:MAG: C-terminal target protein [Bacteroidetes bacterium]|nr:C-terminal target protein [Bacteroidota bacterium]